jgi:hypothetical protein
VEIGGYYCTYSEARCCRCTPGRETRARGQVWDWKHTDSFSFD